MRAVVLVVALVASNAYGEPAELRVPLRYEERTDVWIAAGLVGGWLVTEFGFKGVAPEACRWCEPTSFDLDVRSAMVWEDTGAADLASYGTLALEPVIGFGGLALFGRSGEWRANAVILAQTVGTVGLVTNLVKYSVGRQRPAYHFTGEAPPVLGEEEANLSFISGHTSLAFSCAVGAGTIASLRRYRGAPWIWGAGLAAAFATGAFRIGADAHYVTDVLGGAAVGTLGGLAIPLLLHPRLKETPLTVQAVPAPGGGVIGVAGSW